MWKAEASSLVIRTNREKQSSRNTAFKRTYRPYCRSQPPLPPLLGGMDPTNVVVIEGKDADEPPPPPPPPAAAAAEGKTDGVVKETEELTVELVGPEKGEEQTAGVEKLETVAAAVVPPAVDQPLPASQEAVEAAEAAAVASEASLDIDALAHEAQVRAVREGEAPAQATTEETGESAQVNTVVLVRHRASWWNCCGLLDAITGSKDSSTST